MPDKEWRTPDAFGINRITSGREPMTSGRVRMTNGINRIANGGSKKQNKIDKECIANSLFNNNLVVL